MLWKNIIGQSRTSRKRDYIDFILSPESYKERELKAIKQRESVDSQHASGGLDINKLANIYAYKIKKGLKSEFIPTCLLGNLNVAHALFDHDINFFVDTYLMEKNDLLLPYSQPSIEELNELLDLENMSAPKTKHLFSYLSSTAGGYHFTKYKERDRFLVRLMSSSIEDGKIDKNDLFYFLSSEGRDTKLASKSPFLSHQVIAATPELPNEILQALYNSPLGELHAPSMLPKEHRMAKLLLERKDVTTGYIEKLLTPALLRTPELFESLLKGMLNNGMREEEAAQKLAGFEYSSSNLVNVAYEELEARWLQKAIKINQEKLNVILDEYSSHYSSSSPSRGPLLPLN